MYNYGMSEIDELIYSYIRLIPLGKVTTFGEIVNVVGNNIQTNNIISALRKVQDIGYIPTHRVVTNDGCLTKTFIDGGRWGQKKYLKNEGVDVKKYKVDLSKFCFYFW